MKLSERSCTIIQCALIDYIQRHQEMLVALDHGPSFVRTRERLEEAQIALVEVREGRPFMAPL